MDLTTWLDCTGEIKTSTVCATTYFRKGICFYHHVAILLLVFREFAAFLLSGIGQRCKCFYLRLYQVVYSITQRGNISELDGLFRCIPSCAFKYVTRKMEAG